MIGEMDLQLHFISLQLAQYPEYSAIANDIVTHPRYSRLVQRSPQNWHGVATEIYNFEAELAQPYSSLSRSIKLERLLSNYFIQFSHLESAINFISGDVYSREDEILGDVLLEYWIRYFFSTRVWRIVKTLMVEWVDRQVDRTDKARVEVVKEIVGSAEIDSVITLIVGERARFVEQPRFDMEDKNI